MLNIRGLCKLVAPMLVSLALAPGVSSGQGYPGKPISITVGLQAGTGSDVAIRMITEKMGASMGQPFVVDNLPGAGGVLAVMKGARSTPDGYQLVALSNAALTVFPNLDPKITYDPFKDLIPVSLVVGHPSVLFVRADFPAKNVAEFIAWAKKNPGKMTYASGGNGSAQHLAMELFKGIEGMHIVHIPYKGSGQATLDVASGRVDAGFQGISTVLPFIKSGKIRALAATGAQRAALFPDLPTMAEAGVKDFFYEPWAGIFAPAGTPRDVIVKLHAEASKASRPVEFREDFTRRGMEARDFTLEQFAKIIRDEHATNARVIKERNITAD